MVRRLTVALYALICIACFAIPGRAQDTPAAGTVSKSVTYDVVFVFDDTYSGTMTLTFDKDTISGSMTIDSPVSVTAKVAGTRKDAKLAFDYPFSMGGDEPCNGEVTINATMDAKADAASGTARAVGCSDAPLDGTFSMKRAAEKAPGSGRIRVGA